MQWLSHMTYWLTDVLGMQLELILRLCLAAALGGMVGIEREMSGKPAGFRTNLLICLGAALVTELSRTIALEVGSTTVFRSDPGRIAAQIVSGIGFLGAGTIMQSRGAVTGLTTAATLWVVAAIGMAVGAGAYVSALVASLLVILALMILGRFEDHLVPRRPSERTLEVEYGPDETQLRRIEDLLGGARLEVVSISVGHTEGKAHVASFLMRGAGEQYATLVHTLLAEQGVTRVSLL